MHRATARATRPNESAAPATNSARKALKCCACHELCTKSSKVLRLSRKIVRQGQRKRHSRKRLRACSKQNTSKRQSPKRESHSICNASANLHKTLRLRSKTTSDMLRATIPRTGALKMTRFKKSKWHDFRFPHWSCDRDTREHIRTLADARGRKSTTSGHVLTPRPPTSKRERIREKT